MHERVHGARQRREPQLEAVRVAHRVAAMAARDRPPGKPAQRRTLHAEVRGHDLSELGVAERRLQRAMTAQVEQHERDLLHDDIMALPVDDPRREAWLAVDRLSSQWVSSWPGLDTPLQPALGDAEFGEVVTTYLGMESPALRGLAGRSIPCGHRRHTVCDAHGFQLGLATLPGAVHTIVHNGCSFELWRMMREAGVYCEVEPRHLCCAR